MEEKREEARTGREQGSAEKREVPVRRVARSPDERRSMRREAHATETYRCFIKDIERNGLGRAEAEKAAVSVLCALEQRLLPDIQDNLEAQLPSRLREMLHRCDRHLEGGRLHKFGRAALIRMVGEDLGVGTLEAEQAIRAVFMAVRDQISDDEVAKVIEQLPHEFHDLWRPPM